MVNIDINKLRQHAAPAKSYLWKGEFNDLPDIGVDIESLSLQLMTSQIPSKSYSQIERQWMMHTIPYAGKGEAHGEIDLDLFITQDWDIELFMHEWGQLIEDNQTGEGVPHEEYTANLTTVLLDNRNTDGSGADELVEVEYKMIWPTDTGELDLSYEDDDDAGPKTVTFTYATFDKRKK